MPWDKKSPLLFRKESRGDENIPKGEWKTERTAYPDYVAAHLRARFVRGFTYDFGRPV